MKFTPLRAIRLRAGMTSASVARLMSTDPGLIRRFEVGTLDYSPSDEWISRYARAVRATIKEVRAAAWATFRRVAA